MHLGGPGGFYDDWSKYDPQKSSERELEAYLYCGITAVRSAGDKVDDMLKLRNRFNSGEMLGSEPFPLRAASLPRKGDTAPNTRRKCRRWRGAGFETQFLRIPKTPEESATRGR